MLFCVEESTIYLQLKLGCKFGASSLSTIDKLVSGFKAIPSDFTFSEARKIAKHFGYVECNRGKASGSRVSFYRESDGAMMLLRKPHPGDQMKRAYVRDMLEAMKGFGDLNEG